MFESCQGRSHVRQQIFRSLNVDISITHPAIFRSAVHSVVGVGTFRRAVDSEKWQQSKDQVTKRPHSWKEGRKYKFH